MTYTMQAFKEALRNPSQYSHSEYFLCADGGILSRKAAREEFKLIAHAIMFPEYRDSQWRVVARDINYEDLELRCDHTGAEIPAAYAGE